MVRILGNNLPNKKKIYIALTSIYGIGISTSKKILNNLNISQDLKVSELNEENVSAIRDFLENEDFIGYDAREKKFGNLLELGIIDPKKVVRCALENSVAAANSLLSVGCSMVYDEEN